MWKVLGSEIQSSIYGITLAAEKYKYNPNASVEIKPGPGSQQFDKVFWEMQSIPLLFKSK